jgi:hypothetical protein
MVNRLCVQILAFVVPVCMLFAATPAHPAAVAMVTDLQGTATLEGDAKRAPVNILAELQAGATLQLDANSTLSALYLESGDDYAFKGPALLKFNAAAPEVLKGAPPLKRIAPAGPGGKSLRLKPVGVAQGALVMRGVRPAARIRLLNLSGTKTLEPQPEFRWQELQPAIKYQFELSDETGRTLHEAQTEATSLRLPAGIQLRTSVPYTWEVSTRLADGRKYLSSGDFSVAPAELRQETEALRPAVDAPFSTRVTFAAWLDQMELKDEARKYWRALAAERPDDSRLKELARD